MKILFAASECVPFIKTGGLADVVGALSPVLAQKGVDVRVMVPLYASIPEKWTSQMKSECEFEVELGWRRQYCGVKSLEYQGVTFYFIDNHFYFGRSYIYGLGGDEYERFGFFCRAVIDALPHLGFKPDVVHCHDWQTGMVPALLKIQYAHFPFYQDMKTVYTIHNLQYQGVFPIGEIEDLLETLKYVPTGCNIRHLVFKVVDDKKKLADCRQKVMELLSANLEKLPTMLQNITKSWQKSPTSDAIFRGAPHVLIVYGDPKAVTPQVDCDAACAYFDLLAQAHGIGTTWFGFLTHIFEAIPEAADIFGVPRGVPFHAMLFGDPIVDYPRCVNRSKGARIEWL